MNRKTRIIRLGIVVVTAATGVLALAGDLNPPPGPVGPTMKPLNEVEPRIAINATNTPGDSDSLFKITQPGSYFLTGNISGVAAKHGIEIDAGGVTLDLNGFDLLGVPGSLDGVSTTAGSLTNIAVVNGSVRSWGDEGIDLSSVAAINCHVSNVLASGNAGNGIYTGGRGSTVSNCSAYQNTANGILTSGGSTVSNCSAYLNTANGIFTSGSCTVSNCSAYQNTGTGIITSGGSTVTNCSAYYNTSGIITGSGSTITNCSALENTGNGISAGIGCTVSNCSALENTGNGISASSGSMVSNCAAYQNTGNGFSIGTGSSVIDCTAGGNTLDGIACVSACVIRGNTCSFNGSGGDGAGIHATGIDNRIEGNNCTSADRGIDVDAAGNIIIRNTCSGNTTNWDIAADNVCGPILDRTAPASAAILGDSAPDSTGSTHPNANFTY